MSDTPRTNAAEIDESRFADWGTGPSGYVEVDFARTLERELAATQSLPLEPTETMVIAGFECEAMDRLSSAAVTKGGWPYSCREAAELVRDVYRAMVDARPGVPVPKPCAECSYSSGHDVECVNAVAKQPEPS